VGYDLVPRNKKAEGFYFGAFSWPFFLGHAGLIWPAIFKGPRWFVVNGIDKRVESDYPSLISNDGFRVTAEEARWLGRIAFNLASMNEVLLVETKPTDPKNQTRGRFIDGEYYSTEGPDFRTFREDWNEILYRFSKWAPTSSGFTIH
jgi:hypothetical protein